MSRDNLEQIEFWNGPAAASWAAAEDRMDRMLAPLSRAAIEHAGVRPGEAVIDIGCGCGATSLAIAEMGARVLGIDVSVPMLERARTHGRGNPRVEFVVADAASYAFDAEFDLLFSRFGVMFFADPRAAFANLRGALKTTGRLCFMVWQAITENPWLAAPMAAARPFLPESEAADPRAPGPFSLADAQYLGGILTDAGFTNVTVQPHTFDVRVGSNLAETMEFYTRLGPLSGALAELDTAGRAAAIAAVEQSLAPTEAAASSEIVLPCACWIATAHS